jgi:hypothetical protein
MLASAQTVLHRAAGTIVAAAGFAGEGCGTGCQRATGSLLQNLGISIADAKAGIVEASHLQ